MTTRYQDNAQTTAEPFMVESRIPVGPSRVETHVIVPFLIAVIVMALIALDVLLWEWRPAAGLIGAAGLLAFFWRVILGDRLNWKLETMTGRDLDRDGQIGKPAPFSVLNPADARRTADGYAAASDTRSRQAELLAFVARCATVGESEQAQGIGPGQRELYCDQRDTLIGLGIAAWKVPGNVRLGWRLRVTPAQAQTIIERHIR